MMNVRDDAGMITQQLGYSILTAPLAAIDRRALSQAWYSALHLARSGFPVANVPQQLSKARTAEALDPARPVRRATFSFAGTREGTRARVHVALQSGASGMRLVAVCPAALRAGVARALDQARYALALRGIVLVGVVQ
jgi:hypothetical protein